MRFSIVPLLLIGLPIAEIAVFIIVGRYIGVLPVLALIFLSSGLGALLLRIQGIGVLRKLASEMDSGRLPAREMIDGAMIVLAGLFLLTPGFVTDLIGLLLFIPPVRDLAWRLIRDKVSFTTFRQTTRTYSSGRDGEFEAGPVVDLDEDDYRQEPDSSSPWQTGRGNRRLDRD